jgi:hypothetical protein
VDGWLVRDNVRLEHVQLSKRDRSVNKILRCTVW